MESKEHQHEMKYLKELSRSDFEIKDGQPDIIHWTVRNSADHHIGTVSELLFDEEERKVRYIVLNLAGNTWGLEEREVLIPIGVAELDKEHDYVILPNITAQQITVLPAYLNGTAVISTDSELYGHKDFDEANLYARRQSGSYIDHVPFQIITKIYQEENEAENTVSLLLERGISEKDITVTLYNPLNQLNLSTASQDGEFIGDGSRDEYIVTIVANSAGESELIYQLLDENAL